ncbi:MAG: hypothetical protein U0931_18695 [Vulcanimicrobiota bacterium]
MINVVASWDKVTGQSRIHLILDSNQMPTAERRAQVVATVRALEAEFDAERVEVVSGVARSLKDFRETDPRFLHATGP